MNFNKEVEDMLKKMSTLMVAGALALTVSSCGKQEQTPAGGPPAPAAPKLALPQKGQEATVNLPPEVKAAWKGAKLSVEDRAKKSKQDVVAKIGQDTKIPGTKLTVNVVEFVPAFVMQGLNITSASNEPTNPAAKVTISEGGKEIFKGWLFQKYPTTHAFTHPNYAVTLVEGEKS